jgi:hypothetical protein
MRASARGVEDVTVCEGLESVRGNRLQFKRLVWFRHFDPGVAQQA